MKKALNVFGIILALIFSLVLVPTLILNPVWRGMSGLLEPEFLQNVVSEVVAEMDASDFTLDSSELSDAMTGEGLDPELAQAIVDSAAVREIAPLLGDDLSKVVAGEFTATSLTAAEIQRIGTEHRDELAELLALLAEDEGEQLSEEEAAQVVDQLVADAPALESDLTTAFLELQTELHTEYAEVLALLTGPLVSTVLLVMALVLALLIFLCRWPHQEGLLWLGIDSALAALPVLDMAVSIKGAQVSQALAEGTGMPNVFSPVLRQAGNTILVGGVILLTLAVLLIAGFILLRDRRLKREAAAVAAVPVAPAAADPFTAAPVDPFLPDPAEKSTDSEPRERSPWDNV